MNLIAPKPNLRLIKHDKRVEFFSLSEGFTMQAQTLNGYMCRSRGSSSRMIDFTAPCTAVNWQSSTELGANFRVEQYYNASIHSVKQ